MGIDQRETNVRRLRHDEMVQSRKNVWTVARSLRHFWSLPHSTYLDVPEAKRKRKEEKKLPDASESRLVTWELVVLVTS